MIFLRNSFSAIKILTKSFCFTALALIMLSACGGSGEKSAPKANAKLNTEIVSQELNFAWMKLHGSASTAAPLAIASFETIAGGKKAPFARVTVNLTISADGQNVNKDFIFRVVDGEWRLHDRELAIENSSTLTQLSDIKRLQGEN